MRRSSVTARLGITTTTFALVGSLALAGCGTNPLSGVLGGSSAAEGSGTMAASVAKVQAIPDESLVVPGTLTVGLETSSVGAPFVIVDAAGGLAGIDIDLAAALASDLGLAVSFVEVPNVDGALEGGACDVVMDVSASRSGSAIVLGDYYEVATALFGKDATGVVTVAELAGKTVGLQAGSVSEGVLNSVVLDMARQQYANLNEAFAALAQDEVDYVLCDAYAGAYLASAYEGIGFAGVLNAPTAVGIGVRRDNAAVQTAVEESLGALMVNGTYDVVRGRWLGGMGAVSASEVIANLASAEQPVAQEGEQADLVDDGSQDGSTAGANAVFVPSEE